MVKGLSHATLLTNRTVYELVRTAVNGEISTRSNAGYDGLTIPTVILIISSLAIKKKWKE
jgi:hypothetical protein